MLCIIGKYCDCVLVPKWSSHWKSAVPPSLQSPHISSASPSPPARGTGGDWAHGDWKGRDSTLGTSLGLISPTPIPDGYKQQVPGRRKFKSTCFSFFFVNTFFKVISFMREQFVGWFKFILTYYNIPSLLLHPSFIFSPYLIWCSVPFGCWPFWPFWNSAKQRVGDLAWPQKHANIQASARLSIS